MTGTSSSYRSNDAPHKFAIFLGLVVLAVLLGSLYLMSLQTPNYIPVSTSHNLVHSPALDADARTRVEVLISFWTKAGPPLDPNRVKCIVMMLANVPTRWIVWTLTGFSSTGIPRGDLSWFDRFGWEGSYPNKSGATLLDTPTDLRGNSQISMEEVSCNDFPTLPPLSPAQ